MKQGWQKDETFYAGEVNYVTNKTWPEFKENSKENNIGIYVAWKCDLNIE